MDYKKILKTSKSREMVLNILSFIPDNLMLKLQYYIKMKRKLNLNNPVRLTEKLQWYKINYRNPVMHNCVDKFLVREYVKEKGLGNILIPLLGKYNNVGEIIWDNLPNKFVIKTTEGSGGLNVIVCHNKDELDIQNIETLLTNGQKLYRKNSGGREWAYYGLKPGIIVEELLVNKSNPEAGVNDYKIFCYGGKPKYIIVDKDRYIGHKRNFYDTNWNIIDVSSDCPNSEETIVKPDNLSEMLDIASTLSKEFPFVRIDLYNNDNQIYFGEMTFYPWSGYVQFEPDRYDKIFGEDFELRKYK